MADDWEATQSDVRPQTRAFVIYDKASGDVLHVHRSIAFGKSSRTGEEAPEDRAWRMAGDAAIKKRAAILEVKPSQVDFGAKLRVDLESKKLVRKREQFPKVSKV